MEVLKVVDLTSDCCEEEEEVMLPGFRFHPTDEELVGFYLRRKVEKKPISIEIIKQIDIYKYDPWDLPKVSNVGEKEWYFFCIRGRKYRNSIRPNRVTGSGFWKATGIDKPIFSTFLKEPNQQECIGLKKSLVYYRGSAGKGTKTDWMMHEFRLPFNTNHNTSDHPFIALDAEVWTLCRIFKRIPSYRKYTPTNMKNNSNNNSNNSNPITQKPAADYWSCKTNSSLESDQTSEPYAASFSDSVNIHLEDETKPVSFDDQRNSFSNPNVSHAASFEASNYPSSIWNGFNGGGGGGGGGDDLFSNGSWDELRTVVQFAIDPSKVYGCI